MITIKINFKYCHHKKEIKRRFEHFNKFILKLFYWNKFFHIWFQLIKLLVWILFIFRKNGCANYYSLMCLLFRVNVRFNIKFVNLKGVLDLHVKFIETNKCKIFDMVYKFLKLTLVLKFVKNKLCNKMSDQWLNDRLLTFYKKLYPWNN